MSHQSKIIEEHYVNQARAQLDFKSYMKVALFVCIGFPILYTVFIYSTVEFLSSNTTMTNSILQLLPAIIMCFVFSLVASLIMYPVYNWWCGKHRGQLMSGKFALLRERKEKKRDTVK
ncbi:MAG: hypothetical protein CMP47_00640 [Rickettsiales bacterium]|nr:hypothetical protein [Rickettsiales bacterium]